MQITHIWISKVTMSDTTFSNYKFNHLKHRYYTVPLALPVKSFLIFPTVHLAFSFKYNLTRSVFADEIQCFLQDRVSKFVSMYVNFGHQMFNLV
jgi:hypothetical protein